MTQELLQPVGADSVLLVLTEPFSVQLLNPMSMLTPRSHSIYSIEAPWSMLSHFGSLIILGYYSYLILCVGYGSRLAPQLRQVYHNMMPVPVADASNNEPTLAFIANTLSFLLPPLVCSHCDRPSALIFCAHTGYSRIARLSTRIGSRIPYVAHKKGFAGNS